MPLPVVAIVGRPNVGKSTLFNRLIGFRKAMVHDRAGVTRDRLYEEATVIDRQVLLVDTGGLDPDPDTSDLLASMRRQTLIAVEEADVIVFLVDGRAGFTAADAEVGDLLRRTSKPVVLAVNKIDGQRHEDLAGDFWSVGLTPLVTVSAAHGRGIWELLESIKESLPEADEEADEVDLQGELLEDDTDEAPAFEGPIRIAVVGRPNIGKSTLINRLLGYQRTITSPVAGTTRDSVDVFFERGDQRFVLIDTAGVRKRRKISERLEKLTAGRALRTIEAAHVVLLVVDGSEGVTEQEARLGALAADRGRALTVIVNKWDLQGRGQGPRRDFMDGLRRRFPHLAWADVLFMSALTGRGVHRLWDAVDRANEAHRFTLGTGVLNRWARSVWSTTPPPMHKHRPVRFYYVTQTGIRPPTFTFFCNQPQALSPSYRRFLTNQLRAAFAVRGTPIRLVFKDRGGS